MPNKPFTARAAAYASKGDIDRVPRPKTAPSEAFGLKVVGDCLSPRVRDGQIVVVGPRLPKPGDICVIWFKGQEGCVTKILLTDIAGLYPHNPKSNCIAIVEVEQLNPPRRYSCSIDKIECIASVYSVGWGSEQMTGPKVAAGMTAVKYLDRPPAGWFVLDVMKTNSRKRDWVALMIDVDPDDFIARRANTTKERWVRIPGKHRTWEAARDALEDLLATRH
jgi:hypothetical protein